MGTSAWTQLERRGSTFPGRSLRSALPIRDQQQRGHPGRVADDLSAAVTGPLGNSYDFSRISIHPQVGSTRQPGSVPAGIGYAPLDEFPHYSRVEQAFGTTFERSAVWAPELCRLVGTTAFTVGHTAIFSSRNPSLEVAAHEAAHVAQHRGFTWDLGLGPEGHASAVADAVEHGSAAGTLLARRGDRVPPTVRPYTLVKPKDQRPNHYPVGKTVRVSMFLAVVDES